MGFPGKYGNYGVWEFLGYFYFLGRDLTLKCVGNPAQRSPTAAHLVSIAGHHFSFSPASQQPENLKSCSIHIYCMAPHTNTKHDRLTEPSTAFQRHCPIKKC